MLFRLGDILIVITLVVLAWQDFRSRLISWWLIPVLLLAFVFAGKEQISWNGIGKYFLYNLAFLVLQFAIVWIWMSLRNRKPIRLIDSQIGLGDILFLVCIAAAFSTVNFLFFYTASLIAVLLIAVIIRMIRSSEKMLIPLAGAIAVPMIVLVTARFFDPAVNFYSEEWLLNILNANLLG